ncbi:MAG: hypothetical protein KJO44_02570, partial [Gemmatimonadetes bacterium]|nr:hypothetical protein [Gemmatimonadota bacterium]
QTAWDVDVANQPNYHRCWKLGGLRAERTILVYFQGHRLAIDHKTERPADWYDRQRLERRV